MLVENDLIDQKIRAPVIDKFGRSYGTGRRKNATARVWIKPGTGKVSINGVTDPVNYLKRMTLCQIIKRPFSATDTEDKFDVIATVKGGGLSGQAGALAHGISRALDAMCPDLHVILRRGGFLTRDSRVVERKKYGQHKARKKGQYSKR